MSLKTLAKNVLPKSLVGTISAWHWSRHVRRVARQSGLDSICKRLIEASGTDVKFGPFKGMRFDESVLLLHSNTYELLGTYEMELHPWVEQVLATEYERFLDIGASEGYYAVGFAIRTGKPVDAYDPGPQVQSACRKMANLNGVSKLVRVSSWCSPATLLALEGKRCFVLSDCEGFETELFNGETAKALAHSDMIIELHDRSTPPGTTRKLLESRLASTHELRIISGGARDWRAIPELSFLEFLGDDAVRAVSEPRQSEWLFAVSKLAAETKSVPAP